jgi:Family of unknown function (DUF6174)
MMRFPALAAAALLLSTAAGCAPSAAPSDAPSPAADAPGTDTPAPAALRTWRERGPAAYAYDLTISCFCLHRGRYSLEVRDGRITSARDAATGAPPPAERVEWMVTVDGLFEALARAEQEGKPIRGTFHPTLGYPVEVEIGLLANDSGTLYRIENLRAL